MSIPVTRPAVIYRLLYLIFIFSCMFMPPSRPERQFRLSDNCSAYSRAVSGSNLGQVTDNPEDVVILSSEYVARCW
jgi:hypothetical protein